MALTRIWGIGTIAFNLDLEGMTLSQVHDIPLGHGQQVCEILSRSEKEVRSY